MHRPYPLLGLLLVACGGGGSDEPCRQPLSPTPFAGYVGRYEATFRSAGGTARAFAFTVDEHGGVTGEEETEGEIRGFVGRHSLCSGDRTEIELYFSREGDFAQISAAAKPTPTLDGSYPAVRSTSGGTEKGTLMVVRAEAR